MRRWILPVLLLLGGCTPTWAPYGGPQPSGTAASNGTGIVVSDGVILTARHVVRGCAAIRVASAMDAFRAVPATVRVADDKIGEAFVDLALIDIPRSTAPVWSPARFHDIWSDDRAKTAAAGQGIEVPGLQDLRLLGYPGGALAPEPVEGAVTQLFAFRPQDMSGQHFWGLVGEARPGFSGGPLIDGRGAVLGLATSGG